MAHMDIFNSDAFTMGQMIGTVERAPYKPQLLGSLGIFEEKPVRTTFATIEERDRILNLIPTSPRGAPLVEGSTMKRRLRRFDTVRIAKQDRVNASEVEGIRAYGSETELRQVQDLVVEKQVQLYDDLELTLELHRLGAVQGVVLDADGSTIHDWFGEFGLSKPSAVSFAFSTTGSGAIDVEKLIRQSVLRPMQKAAKGAWTPETYVTALCGDAFYDALTTHPSVKATYLNWLAAKDLRQGWGASDVKVDGAFAGFRYGGVVWLNYRGVDTYDPSATKGVNTVGINPNNAAFFPVNAPGVFQVARSPGEGMDDVNTPGRPVYFELELEKRANPRWVDLELYSYPLHICTRPEMLLNGVAA